MYRCRHEQGEDSYASGNENRRRNRDRLNGDIERYNLLRQIRSGDHGLPFSGPRGMPAGMYGLGTRGPPSFRPGRPRVRPPLEHIFGVPREPIAFPGIFGPRPRPYLPLSLFDDDDDDEVSDDDEYSLPLPPPWCEMSPFSRRGRCLPLSSGRPYGGQRFRNLYRNYCGDYGDYEDDGYLYMPRPFYSRRGAIY